MYKYEVYDWDRLAGERSHPFFTRSKRAALGELAKRMGDLAMPYKQLSEATRLGWWELEIRPGMAVTFQRILARPDHIYTVTVTDGGGATAFYYVDRAESLERYRFFAEDAPPGNKMMSARRCLATWPDGATVEWRDRNIEELAAASKMELHKLIGENPSWFDGEWLDWYWEVGCLPGQ
jgi:hypothetical protein